MQNFHRFQYKWDYNVEIVRGEKRKDHTITKRFRKLYDAIDEESELDNKIHEDEWGEIGFQFDFNLKGKQ